MGSASDVRLLQLMGRGRGGGGGGSRMWCARSNDKSDPRTELNAKGRPSPRDSCFVRLPPAGRGRGEGYSQTSSSRGSPQFSLLGEAGLFFFFSFFCWRGGKDKGGKLLADLLACLSKFGFEAVYWEGQLGSLVVRRAGVGEGPGTHGSGRVVGSGRGPAHHKSSYCRRCIRWMMSRQSLKTRRMFSVSTAQVKCG